MSGNESEVRIYIKFCRGAQKFNIIVVENGKDLLSRETSDFKHTLRPLLI